MHEYIVGEYIEVIQPKHVAPALSRVSRRSRGLARALLGGWLSGARSSGGSGDTYTDIPPRRAVETTQIAHRLFILRLLHKVRKELVKAPMRRVDALHTQPAGDDGFCEGVYHTVLASWFVAH